MVGPTGSSDIVAAVPSPFDSSGASNSAAGKSPYLIWTFTLPGDLSVLMANMTLWVDVEGTVVGDPFPTANGCFWNAMIQVHQDPQSLPGQLAPPSALTSTCGVEPLQVPTGIRALQLKFPVAQGTLAKGTQLDLALNSNAFASPAAHVDMLTGSTVHDSQISLQGLQMPLDPEGLLGAMGPPA
ncbi:MAG TPA: hypothetical protein VM286_01390 [Candidatus Thermoplasmatota archaeon]|nr:hypothetical protein [Candidatus Thermoplasmatota archaeon]